MPRLPAAGESWIPKGPLLLESYWRPDQNCDAIPFLFFGGGRGVPPPLSTLASYHKNPWRRFEDSASPTAPRWAVSRYPPNFSITGFREPESGFVGRRSLLKSS